MTEHTVTVSGSTSIINRQTFESHAGDPRRGLERAHLETIFEVVGTEHLVMLEIQDGFGHTGRLHGVSTTQNGYNTPTLGLTSLYEGAYPTYYRGPDVRQVVVLTDCRIHHRVIEAWRNLKMDALRAVRATLEKDDAWAGKWEMAPRGYGEVYVTRQRTAVYDTDRWTVQRNRDGGRTVHVHRYEGPLAPLSVPTAPKGA